MLVVIYTVYRGSNAQSLLPVVLYCLLPLYAMCHGLFEQRTLSVRCSQKQTRSIAIDRSVTKTDVML